MFTNENMIYDVFYFLDTKGLFVENDKKIDVKIKTNKDNVCMKIPSNIYNLRIDSYEEMELKSITGLERTKLEKIEIVGFSKIQRNKIKLPKNCVWADW